MTQIKDLLAELPFFTQNWILKLFACNVHFIILKKTPTSNHY